MTKTALQQCSAVFVMAMPLRASARAE